MTPYYSDEHVTIFHGDALEIMGGLDYDVVVTDPPYGIGWTRGFNKARGSRAHEGIQNDGDTAHRDWVLEQFDGPALVFGSLYAPFPTNLKHVLIWEKPNDAGVVGSTTGYRRDIEAVFMCEEWPQRNAKHGSVLKSQIPMIGGTRGPAGRTGHPHTKPTDLIREQEVLPL